MRHIVHEHGGQWVMSTGDGGIVDGGDKGAILRHARAYILADAKGMPSDWHDFCRFVCVSGPA
jgi:hypothetical protein